MPGGLVEIAGGLVGDQDGGIGRQRTRQRHALLLAAGQFGRVMIEPGGKADRGKLAFGALERVVLAGELERHRHVLQRRHGGNEVEGLEHDADMGAAKAGEPVFIELAELVPRHDHVAGIRPLQSGHDHQQGRFARTGRSEQRDRLAAPYMQADVAQDMHTCGAAAERQVDAVERDGVAAGRKPRNVIHAPNSPRPALVGDRLYGRRRVLFQIAAAAAFRLRWRRSRRGATRRSRSWRSAIRSRPDTGFPTTEGFVPRLQAALAAGIAAEVANGGVSGDTAADGLARLDWSVPQGTDAVMVELGANDMLRGIAPAVTRDALDAILRRLTGRHMAVLFCGMRAAPNLGAAYGAAFERIYPELAAKYGTLLYPFFLDGVAADLKLTQPDGLHPNAAGVGVIVGRILPSVKDLVARSPPAIVKPPS